MTDRQKRWLELDNELHIIGIQQRKLLEEKYRQAPPCPRCGHPALLVDRQWKCCHVSYRDGCEGSFVCPDEPIQE